jgi:hypothetical protein
MHHITVGRYLDIHALSSTYPVICACTSDISSSTSALTALAALCALRIAKRQSKHVLTSCALLFQQQKKIPRGGSSRAHIDQAAHKATLNNKTYLFIFSLGAGGCASIGSLVTLYAIGDGEFGLFFAVPPSAASWDGDAAD